MNLHSIMLLLYRKGFSILSYLYMIYIPLCFYFIGKRQHWHDTVLHIYIPLCFYFINRYETWNLIISNIYIPLCFYFIFSCTTLNAVSMKSTFHYASTLSDMGRFVYRLKNYLHSIMLLLYRGSGRGNSPDCSIYIPLCFYFINGWQ